MENRRKCVIKMESTLALPELIEISVLLSSVLYASVLSQPQLWFLGVIVLRIPAAVNRSLV